VGSGSYELTAHLGLDCLGTDDPNVAGPTSRKYTLILLCPRSVVEVTHGKNY